MDGGVGGPSIRPLMVRTILAREKLAAMEDGLRRPARVTGPAANRIVAAQIVVDVSAKSPGKEVGGGFGHLGANEHNLWRKSNQVISKLI